MTPFDCILIAAGCMAASIALGFVVARLIRNEVTERPGIDPRSPAGVDRTAGPLASAPPGAGAFSPRSLDDADDQSRFGEADSGVGGQHLHPDTHIGKDRA